MTTKDEEVRVAELVKQIMEERGAFADEGACWVTFSDGSQRCYRDLDAEGSQILARLSGLTTDFYTQRFCP